MREYIAHNESYKLLAAGEVLYHAALALVYLHSCESYRCGQATTLSSISPSILPFLLVPNTDGSHPIVHRDVKSGNVLLLEDPSIGLLHGKLADIGESRQVADNTMTVTGTYAWMAPELGRGEQYDESIDTC